MSWMKDIEGNKLGRTIKSEPVPDYTPDPGEPKTIVAKTMEEMIFTKDKDVLLNVFAPWCGHCKPLISLF